MQEYMKQKSLENSRLEFLLETNMIETRMNMKGNIRRINTNVHIVQKEDSQEEAWKPLNI